MDMATTKKQAQQLASLREQVCKELDIDTLETRKRDSLDFHDIAVWQLEKVMQMAFEAGMKAGKQ